MGYCYEGRKLCCDGCPKAGGVRKRRCKYNYCPAPAYCKECWATKKDKFRAYCEENCCEASKVFNKQMADRQAVIDNGGYLLASALKREDGLVDVWFRSAVDEKILVMTETEYVIPEGKNWMDALTPADFGRTL